MPGAFSKVHINGPLNFVMDFQIRFLLVRKILFDTVGLSTLVIYDQV
jgi:hypothetical protein